VQSPADSSHSLLYKRRHARPTKISFADLRDSDVLGLVVYCADYRCSHSIAISADEWPDDMRLSDIEARAIT
jgi:hypothetical protein